MVANDCKCILVILIHVHIDTCKLIWVSVQNPEADKSVILLCAYRLPSGSGNPYLALAATLGAGIEGIKSKIQPPQEGAREDSEPLPKSLSDALAVLGENQTFRTALGEEFVENYIQCRSKCGVEKYGDHNLKEAIDTEIDKERSGHFEYM